MKKLTVYPTSPALRQAQARAVEAKGFFDSRGHVSVRMLMDSCAEAARKTGLLSADDGSPLAPISDLEHDLAVVESAARFRRQAAGQGVLGSLSETALEEVLVRLIAYVDPLADNAFAFLELLEKDSNPKNGELAKLYRVYDAALVELGYASAARVNVAILQILRRPQADWPAVLRGVEQVIFTGLRWMPPFVELVARALAAPLGGDKVKLVHILEEHEQEWWGEKLMAQAGTLVFGGEAAREEWSEFNAAETVASIGGLMSRLGKLSELREGYAMLDPALAAPARPHVGFSQSVGIYGEVEDLARRIAWWIETGRCLPEEIAFCARNLGDYSDAVTDVFSRFGIPYYFRRGVPVMSTAAVKDVLNLVHFSVSCRRDTFCSLLDSPWLDWRTALGGEGEEDEIIPPRELADAIRRSGVDPEITSEQVLIQRLQGWFSGKDEEAARKIPPAAAKAFRLALGARSITSLSEAVQDIRRRCKVFGIENRLQDWAAHSGRGRRDAAAYVLNARGFTAVMNVLDELEPIARHTWHEDMNWRESVAVISRCISNLTVADPGSTSSGVWVVTPYDMAGLRFKAVLAAGLNSGTFPVIPSQSAIFTDTDLERFRTALSKARLPNAALAGSRARNSQENLLFLSMMAAADGGMVFSRTSRDETGQEVPASVFYSTLWRLVGWSALEEDFPEQPPDPYDRWRLDQAPAVFGGHWKIQAGLAPHERQPFHGESFLASVPPALCRAADEARQSVALNPIQTQSSGAGDAVAAGVSRSLAMESARGRFFDRLADGEEAEILPERADAVGEIGKELAAAFLSSGSEPMDFGTTALQDLVNCPYKYFLSRMMGLNTLETNELEASPMDFGSALHRVMETGFLLLLGQNARAAAKFAGVSALLAAGVPGDLAEPAYMIPAGGSWKYIGRQETPPADALPLVVFDPDRKEEYLTLFEKICEAFRDSALSGDETWKLGPAEMADIQWDQIRAGACSLIEAQFGLTDKDYAKMAGGGPRDRYLRGTVFVEHIFDSRKDSRHPSSDAPSVEFTDPVGGGGKLRVHGVVDRVDLLFHAEADHELKALLVLDYKGASKNNKNAKSLAADIAAGRDCQLPVYGTAARQRLLTEASADLPVICQYLIYKLDGKANGKAMRNWWITLTGHPLAEEDLREICGTQDLMGAFLRRIFECCKVLQEGRFTVRPDTCEYCDYNRVCRFTQPSLEKEDETGL